MAAEPAVRALMKDGVDPAAQAFWAAGNDPPEHETEVEAAARWAAAARAAEQLQAEAARLAAPPFSRPGRWNADAAAMAAAAAAGLPVIRARNAEGAFEAGGQLYESCAGCHKAYAPPRG